MTKSPPAGLAPDGLPSPDDPSVEGGDGERVICLCETRDVADRLAERLGDGIEVVAVRSPARAVTMMATGAFRGIYADAAGLGPAADASYLLHTAEILRGMPDGVVLLDREQRVVWGNGRLREWSGREDVIGQRIDDLLGGAEVVGPVAAPFDEAFASDRPAATTLRTTDNRFFRVTAAPVRHFDRDQPEHLVVTVRDVTGEQLQQQKLAAIHQAGIELADLTAEEVANMEVDERVDLLKSNILAGTQDVLQFDVVEVRVLDQETGELVPLLAEGIKPEAERRVLHAAESGNGVTGWVAATGQSYLCEDTCRDPLYIEGCQDARSSLTVPLLLHDHVIGTFNVESPEPGAFSESDRQFLEIFTRDVAIALNTMDLLAAEKATAAAASVEAIHSAVALPMDDILNDAVHVVERYIGHEPEVVERLQRILRNARDIKRVIQQVGQTLAPVEARPASVRPESRPLLLHRRLLVVDADETVRGSAHDLLERYGCFVETAHDGREAVYMTRNLGPGQAYDAILADIRLPDMSGYELLMTLKGVVAEQPPLILMTGFGYDPGHTIVKARQAGLKSVLYKPFRLDQLLETVEQTVADRRQA